MPPPAGRIEALRLIALPLARQPLQLTYYYAQRIPKTAPPPTHASISDATADTHSKGNAAIGQEQSIFVKYMNKGTDLGARQWDALGKAPKGNWKWRIYMFGERAMDRIPFEEWSLKGIDPAVAPRSLRRLLANEKADSLAKADSKGDEAVGSSWQHMVPFIYPPSQDDGQKMLSSFRTSLAQREPYHRKWMKYDLYLSPLTLPFAIVPLIPNLPFFYMIWRSWSHWRAFKASEYLNQLLGRGLVRPQPSQALDQIYKKALSNPAITSPGEPGMLLTKEMVPSIIEALELGPGAEGELNRAVDQAKARLKNMTVKE